mmetsp:Transcript_50046/g.127339  ORF Transcript_50046/g.127339 Transcript_50046/m.127339 type:complete len:203 (+) Transcript_50046:284-892(+)
MVRRHRPAADRRGLQRRDGAGGREGGGRAERARPGQIRKPRHVPGLSRASLQPSSCCRRRRSIGARRREWHCCEHIHCADQGPAAGDDGGLELHKGLVDLLRLGLQSLQLRIALLQPPLVNRARIRSGIRRSSGCSRHGRCSRSHTGSLCSTIGAPLAGMGGNGSCVSFELLLLLVLLLLQPEFLDLRAQQVALQGLLLEQV